MASKSIEEAMQRASPESRAEMLKAAQEIKNRGGQESAMTQDPRPINPVGPSRPNAEIPKAPGAVTPQRENNAIGQAMAKAEQSKTAEQGETLQKQGVSKEQTPER